jgi:hypothetical protein
MTSEDIAIEVFTQLKTKVREILENRQKLAIVVHGQLETKVRKILENRQRVAMLVYNLLLSKVRQIAPQKTKTAAAAAAAAASPSASRSFQAAASLRQGLTGFATRAYETMKNLLKTTLTPSPPVVPPYPESYKKFLDKTNLVQIESQSAIGKDVTTVGLVGLKNLGEPFQKMDEGQSVELPQYKESLA